MSDAQTDVAALNGKPDYINRLRDHGLLLQNDERDAIAATLESQARELAEARRERDELREAVMAARAEIIETAAQRGVHPFIQDGRRGALRILNNHIGSAE
jgi:uncharacterized protein YgbK (DUF1537 family)